MIAKGLKYDFVGPSSGFAFELISQLGEVKVRNEFELQTEADVVLVDCRFIEHSLDGDCAKLILDGGKSLGLLWMNDDDREALAAVVDRHLSSVTEHALMHVWNTKPGIYGFTLIPSNITDMTVDDAVRYLNESVVHADSGGPPPHQAPPVVQTEFVPSVLVNEYSGSVVGLVDGVASCPIFNTPGRVYMTIKSDAYCYHDNGPGGDGFRHMIIVSTITQATAGSGTLTPIANSAGYGLEFTMQKDGAPMAGGVKQYAPSPLASSARSSALYGSMIEIGFGAEGGAGSYPVNLNVLAAAKSGQTINVPLSPTYNRIINQLGFPLINSFTIENEQTTNKVAIRFVTQPGIWKSTDGALADTRFTSKDVSEVAQPQGYTDASAVTAGTFAMTSYWVFDEVGSSASYPVKVCPAAQFEFIDENVPNVYLLSLAPVTIDLVKATACPTCAEAPTEEVK